MRTIFLAGLLFIPLVHLFAQPAHPEKIRVMTLGVFHFNYPNLDKHQIATGNEIDVLLPEYRAQIKRLVSEMKKFKPEHIAVEVEPKYQAEFDSLYNSYLKGKFKLGRDEVYQIGFRLGKVLGIKHLTCVDEQGRYYNYLDTLFRDSVRESRFDHYFTHNPDSLLEKAYTKFYTYGDKLPKSRGVIYTLEQINRPAFIRHLQGAYFIGDFKYEEKPGDFAGVDFETCRWYNRNLRIFRNIQRITNRPGDRILLIIGNGHLGLLNYFLQCSPEYELVSPLRCLK